MKQQKQKKVGTHLKTTWKYIFQLNGFVFQEELIRHLAMKQKMEKQGEGEALKLSWNTQTGFSL